MTDLYVRRGEEVRDRDDGDRFVTMILRPDYPGDDWFASYNGRNFSAKTRGRVISDLETHLILNPPAKRNYESVRLKQDDYRRNLERHRNERGVRKVKGAK